MICQVSELSFTGTRYLNSGIRYQPRYQNSENQVLVIPVPALCLIQVQVYLVPASIPIPGSAQPLFEWVVFCLIEFGLVIINIPQTNKQIK